MTDPDVFLVLSYIRPMNPRQLYELIIAKSKDLKSGFKFTELQSVILEEMCEHVINSETVDHSNENEMILISLNSMDEAYCLMKSLITGIVDSYGSISLNFHGRDFCFDSSNKMI